MDLRYLFALSIFSVSASVQVAAQSCDLGAFDQGAPSSVSDTSPASPSSQFIWGSDVDEVDDGGRGWNFIQNIHSDNLSLEWRKTGLVIPFDKPLPLDGIRCDYSYGSIESYVLDEDAPILVTNDGDKAARAYIHRRAPAEVSGSGIETDYVNDVGETVFGYVKMILRYFISDRYLQIELASGPQGILVGLNPTAFGITGDEFVSAAAIAGVEHSEIAPLSDLVRLDDLGTRALGGGLSQDYILLDAGESTKLDFSQVELVSGAFPLLMVDSEGSAIAMTPLRIQSDETR